MHSPLYSPWQSPLRARAQRQTACAVPALLLRVMRIMHARADYYDLLARERGTLGEDKHGTGVRASTPRAMLRCCSVVSALTLSCLRQVQASVQQATLTFNSSTARLEVVFADMQSRVSHSLTSQPTLGERELYTKERAEVSPDFSELLLSNGVALDVYPDAEGNLTGDTHDSSSSQTSGALRKTASKATSSPAPSARATKPTTLSADQQAHSVNYGKSVLQVGNKQLLVARLDHNYQLEVAAGKLNNLKLPWQSIIADTTTEVALQIRGNSLLVAPHNIQPVVLVVRDQEHPENTITLTLLPQTQLESVSWTVVIPELLRDQLLLAQRELHASAYLGTLTRLMRGMAEQLQAGAIRPALHPYYSLENFEFLAQEVTPNDLEVVELQLDSTTQKQRFPVLAYNCDWGQLQVSNPHLYQPTNLYYANLRFKLVTLVNRGETNLEWSFDDCMPPNVVAASLLDHEHLIPAHGKSRLLLLEKLNY